MVFTRPSSAHTLYKRLECSMMSIQGKQTNNFLEVISGFNWSIEIVLDGLTLWEPTTLQTELSKLWEETRSSLWFPGTSAFCSPLNGEFHHRPWPIAPLQHFLSFLSGLCHGAARQVSFVVSCPMQRHNITWLRVRRPSANKRRCTRRTWTTTTHRKTHYWYTEWARVRSASAFSERQTCILIFFSFFQKTFVNGMSKQIVILVN